MILRTQPPAVREEEYELLLGDIIQLLLWSCRIEYMLVIVAIEYYTYK